MAPLDLDSLARRYRTGSACPADVAEEVLGRIAARGDDHVWITLRPAADLLGDAAALALRWPDPHSRPPLYGVPFAVKDNVDVAGLPTTAACPDYAYVPDRSAPLVDRLLAAGALLVGKTNLDQFATGLSGTRSPYGACESPLVPGLISGGSSSGSAVAVGAGLVTFAIGTDTAGSGRVPAALTGTVGVKPSRGLVSTLGVVPACASLDCPQRLRPTRSPTALAVLSVIAGPEPADPWSRVLPLPSPVPPAARPLRIGVPSRARSSSATPPRRWPSRRRCDGSPASGIGWSRWISIRSSRRGGCCTRGRGSPKGSPRSATSSSRTRAGCIRSP